MPEYSRVCVCVCASLMFEIICATITSTLQPRDKAGEVEKDDSNELWVIFTSPMLKSTMSFCFGFALTFNFTLKGIVYILIYYIYQYPFSRDGLLFLKHHFLV